MSALPELKVLDCSSLSVLSLLYKRAETRIRTSLGHFNKFSLRLSNQSNSFAASSAMSSNSIQDLGYWENEFMTRQAEMVKTLRLLTTLVALITIFPNILPGQEWNDTIEYLEPYAYHDENNNANTSPRLDPTLIVANIVSQVQSWAETNHIVQPPTLPPPPATSTNSPRQVHVPNREPYQYRPISITPTQITYSRRCLAVLSELVTDYNRSRDLCQSALNRMHLFAPTRQNGSPFGLREGADGEYGGDGGGADAETDGDMSDVEAQLLHHEQKYSNSHNLLKAENRLIHESLKQSQYAINNAQQSTDSLSRQRDMFSNIIGRLGQVAGRFPGMNSAMSAIQNRRHRDNCILAALVAFLIFITFLYVRWKHS